MQPAKVITRRELHDLIWTIPVQKLAKQFGLSDRGLGKLCTRYEIPCPPRGYWARVAAGQPAKRRQLLKATSPSLETIHIHPTAPLAPEVLAVKEELQRIRCATPSLTAEEPAKIEDFIEKPHRSILRTATALRKAEPDRDGGISAIGDGMCGVIIHVSQCERVISILHALAMKLAHDGLIIEPARDQMTLRLGPDSISFRLSEKYHREKHRPTPDEQAEHDRAVARERKRQGAAFFWAPKVPWPEYDRIYEGKIVLKIEGWADGVRRSWSDGTIQFLDRMVDILAEGLKVALVAERVRREEQEQRAIRAAEMERRRELAQKRKKREELRIEHVRRMVALRKEADETETWLNSMMDGASFDRSASFDYMLSWTRRRITQLRNQHGALASTVVVHDIDLFPEVDELQDPNED